MQVANEAMPRPRVQDQSQRMSPEGQDQGLPSMHTGHEAVNELHNEQVDCRRPNTELNIGKLKYQLHQILVTMTDAVTR